MLSKGFMFAEFLVLVQEMELCNKEYFYKNIESLFKFFWIKSMLMNNSEKVVNGFT